MFRSATPKALKRLRRENDLPIFVHTRSREELMMMIDKERASTVYPHEECSDECKKRGILF